MSEPLSSPSTRRSFIQQSAALGAGALLAGNSAIAQGAFAGEAEKVYRVGLIGCGGRGRRGGPTDAHC